MFSPCVLSSAFLTFILIYYLHHWPLSGELDGNLLRSKIFSNSTCLQLRGLLSTQLYYIPVFSSFVNNTTNSQSPKWVTLLILKPLPYHNNCLSITCQVFYFFFLFCVISVCSIPSTSLFLHCPGLLQISAVLPIPHPLNWAPTSNISLFQSNYDSGAKIISPQHKWDYIMKFFWWAECLQNKINPPWTNIQGLL